jgi:hypothetical protein
MDTIHCDADGDIQGLALILLMNSRFTVDLGAFLWRMMASQLTPQKSLDLIDRPRLSSV